MKVYTSYYAMLKKIPKEMEPIAISLQVPNWYHGKTCKILAPLSITLWNYKKDNDKEKYIKQYKETVLNRFNPQELLDMIREKIGDKDIVFLCYEAADKFCHRHIIADWFNENGIPCEELRF